MLLVKDTATTYSYTYLHTLSLHDALPFCNGNNGLMIDAPNSVTGDEDLKVALLTPAAPHLQIRSFGGQFSSAWKTAGRSGRLSRATLNIPRSEEHTSEL